MGRLIDSVGQFHVIPQRGVRCTRQAPDLGPPGWLGGVPPPQKTTEKLSGRQPLSLAKTSRRCCHNATKGAANVPEKETGISTPARPYCAGRSPSDMVANK